MGVVSVLNTAFASIALFTCMLQLFLSLKRRGDNLSLTSAVLSFIVFLRYALIFFCSSPLVINEYHLTLWRCQLILTQAVLICMVGMIYFLLKDRRKVIILINVIIISILALVALLVPDYQLFGTNEVSYMTPLDSTGNIPMIGHGLSLWRVINDITVLLFLFISLTLLAKKIRSEHQKKISVLILGSCLIFLTALYDQFVDLGLINSTYLLPFALFINYMVLNFIPYIFLLEDVEQNAMISLQEKKWRDLLYGTRIIVVGLNRMGHVEFVNPYFLELTGYQEDEVLGKDWFEHFIPPKESYHVQGAFIEALESEFHPHYINPVLTRSKKERIIRWYNVRTRDINGNITGSLSLGLDITEDLKEKEDLIVRLKSALELIDKLQKK
jgi:PAS domain S-box-containing protein